MRWPQSAFTGSLRLLRKLLLLRKQKLLPQSTRSTQRGGLSDLTSQSPDYSIFQSVNSSAPSAVKYFNFWFNHEIKQQNGFTQQTPLKEQRPPCPWVPSFHKNPPLYTLKLASGRKAEIRRRRIGLLFVLAAWVLVRINPSTSAINSDVHPFL